MLLENMCNYDREDVREETREIDYWEPPAVKFIDREADGYDDADDIDLD